ncbi:MAG: histidine kinase [Chloroflexi bacterium]|nr:histidine kinase [Chloroflexota bacterium]
MQLLYLTPASIGYLTQFILSLVITGYLLRGCLQNPKVRSTQTVLLTGVFAVTTLFVGLLFLEAALPPAPRLSIVYLENTVLGVLLVLLLQFAYRFLASFSRRKWEMYLVLGLSVLYTLYEAGFAVYRFILLFGQKEVEYRYPEADYALAALFIWVPVTFLLQSVAADKRPIHWLRKLWQPQGLEARGARTFSLAFFLLLALSIVAILEGFSFISTTVYSACLSLGILLAIWLFATTYLNFLPESTSFLVKLCGVTLTLLLGILGLVGWAVSPGYLTVFRPTLADHQTLHFTPNAQGGYDVTQPLFYFESNMGERLPINLKTNENRNYVIDFPFPFYGKTYHQIYVTNAGTLNLDQTVYRANLQLDYTASPALFPLLVDLRPEQGQGIFARVEPDRLIVTWNKLPELDNPNAVYTFQAVLYRDGSFDFTYNGLPDPLFYTPDALPSTNPWLRGMTSGFAGTVAHVNDLSQPVQSPQGQGSAQGLIQDFYLDFRHHLHNFIAPLAWLILASSLLLILGLPTLVNSNLIKPLNALLVGIERVESGDLGVKMPIQFRDEIGSLTVSFNTMAAQLRAHVTELEERVAERTEALQDSNAHLKAEAHERELAEMQVIQQQRDLATAQEREQVSRELHDGLGQALGYINLQAQTAQMLMEQNQLETAGKNLDGLVHAAQEAHTNLRHYILGLRQPLVPQRNFYEALQAYLGSFHQAWGIKTTFSASAEGLPWLSATVEDQLLHIVQEALVNIRKHANARQVDVNVDLLNDEMTLSIGDDGQGFDLHNAPGAAQEHFGLNIMRERAGQVGGQLVIRSTPGQGTQIVVSVPITTGPTPS